MIRIAAFLSLFIVSVSAEGCSICGEGKKVNHPNGTFIFPGQPVVECGDLEEAGGNGTIPLAECLFLPDLVEDVCNCVLISPPTMAPFAPTLFMPVAPVAPVTMPPVTMAPVTGAPEMAATKAPTTVAPAVPTLVPVTTAPITAAPNTSGASRTGVCIATLVGVGALFL
eukprot:CAMPEP_0119014350 /NCGR_PEP_ID=MMETSP1176-20130426/9550_1 /TAXON_ID=265551 /ORGANISM="Synedropsis recta cf, Strain CCMP1620" /LENGTH=168 /DNA_ID=CAMNT_0006967507 /DNA_START=50 /DNA_END=556 /DNA_ORIENTATION=+